jgi:hypothetical protein
MTPTDKLAAVVAKLRRHFEAIINNWDRNNMEAVRNTAVSGLNYVESDVQPILAELQRAQGRLTEEQVNWINTIRSVTYNHGQCLSVIDALLSAPTPAEPKYPLSQRELSEARLRDIRKNDPAPSQELRDALEDDSWESWAEYIKRTRLDALEEAAKESENCGAIWVAKRIRALTPATTTPEPNPFEDETEEEMHRRIGRMIRENVDKRRTTATPRRTAALETLDGKNKFYARLTEELNTLLSAPTPAEKVKP